jgi:hypothetical protein
MQAERDILTRLVFPRHRAMLAARDAALQEVDLRWGVTRTMARDGGALAVCLRELAGCFPLILGMVGRRAGWAPPREVLCGFDDKFATTVAPAAGMTEIEMRYALHLAGRNPESKLLIIVRSDRLSQSIELDETEWTASDAFRRWALTSPDVQAVKYDSFDEFERRVDAELARLLLAQLDQVRPRGVAVAALPELARLRDLTELSRAASWRRPTLVVGERGVGASWLVRRWVSEDPAGLYIDERNLAATDLAEVLRAGNVSANDPPINTSAQNAAAQVETHGDRLTSSLWSRLSREPAARRIVFDHYEDGAASEARSDIAWIPTKLPRGCGVLVVTRSERLQEQAAGLGWQLHEIKAINQGEAVAFAEQYLGAFSKHLVPQQISALKSAPWATNLASLILALDELRRHGGFETLDQRLAGLVACPTGAALIEELVSGLTSVMPQDWSHAVEDALLAIRMSLRGLEEREIRAAVGASADAPASREPELSMPAHLWSAIRISLASAFAARGPLIDVAGGPMLEWLDRRFLARPTQVQSIAAGLSAALQRGPAMRRWTEAPRIAEVRGGAAGLAQFLSEPANVQGLVDVGETFADGWLARLARPSVRRVVAGWEARLAASGSGMAWQLGLMAARSGETDAGLRLMELDAAQRSGAGSVSDPSRTKAPEPDGVPEAR